MDATVSGSGDSSDGSERPGAASTGGQEEADSSDGRPRWYDDPVFMACAVQDFLRALGISETRMRAIPPLFGFDVGLDQHPTPQRALLGDLLPLVGEVLEALEREWIGADLVGVDSRAVQNVLPSLMDDLRQAEVLDLSDEELEERMAPRVNRLPELPMVTPRKPSHEEVGRIVTILQRMPQPTLRHITPVTNRLALHAVVSAGLLAVRRFAALAEEGPFTRKGLSTLRSLGMPVPDEMTEMVDMIEEAGGLPSGADDAAYEKMPDGSWRRVDSEEPLDPPWPWPLNQEQVDRRRRRVHRVFLFTLLGVLLPVLVLLVWIAVGQWPPEYGDMSILGQAARMAALVVGIAAVNGGMLSLIDGQALRGIEPSRRRIWTRLTALVGVCAGTLLPVLSTLFLLSLDTPMLVLSMAWMLLVIVAACPLWAAWYVLKAAGRADELDHAAVEAVGLDSIVVSTRLA